MLGDPTISGRPQSPPMGRNVTVLFALFLLLLAFFILLSAISQAESTRAKAALAAMSAQFGALPIANGVAADPRTVPQATEQLAAELNDLLPAISRDMSLTREMHVLRLSLPLAEAVPEGAPAAALVDGIARAALANGAHNVEIEFPNSADMAARQTRIAAAGETARQLVAHGVAPTAIAIGLADGTDQVSVTFVPRGAPQARVR